MNLPIENKCLEFAWNVSHRPESLHITHGIAGKDVNSAGQVKGFISVASDRVGWCDRLEVYLVTLRFLLHI